LNCDVELAADGEEMVERFLKADESGRSFDLLILDLSVPGGMGGLETMKVLQEINPDVAAVLSTGFSDDSKVGDLRQLGFRGVLPKPYRIDDIRELLGELVPGYSG
ncbi:MAG: response regulator, partial [Methanolinea sp.]|nr:response regulator [Methanolinea sp.]